MVWAVAVVRVDTGLGATLVRIIVVGKRAWRWV